MTLLMLPYNIPQCFKNRKIISAMLIMSTTYYKLFQKKSMCLVNYDTVIWHSFMGFSFWLLKWIVSIILILSSVKRIHSKKHFFSRFFWTSCKLHFFVIVVDAVYIPVSTPFLKFMNLVVQGSSSFWIVTLKFPKVKCS